jgi:hypothetical protein
LHPLTNYPIHNAPINSPLFTPEILKSKSPKHEILRSAWGAVVRPIQHRAKKSRKVVAKEEDRERTMCEFLLETNFVCGDEGEVGGIGKGGARIE